MVRKFSLALTGLLLITGVQAPLRAATDDSEKQMDQLYKMLANTLSGGRKDPNSMIILANPGLPLSKGFEKSNPEDIGMLARLADIVPKASPAFIQNGDWRYSSIFETILTSGEPAPSPGLSEEDRAELKKARATLRKHQDTYYELEDAVTAAQSEIDLIRSRGGEPSATQKSALVRAQRKLAQDESYEECPKASDTIRSLIARDGKARWDVALSRFQVYKTNDYYPVVFFPPCQNWVGDKDDWTEFTFKSGDKVDDSQTSSYGWNADAKGTVGKVTASASASGSSKDMTSLMSNSTFTMTFKVKRIAIMRPWWDSQIIASRYWKLPKQVHDGPYSYGDFETNRKMNADMPTYTTGLFLIKDLVINVAMDATTKKEYEKALKAQADVKCGPVTVSGGYSSEDKGSKTKSTVTETGFSCPGMQLLAWDVLCPNQFPNPNF